MWKCRLVGASVINEFWVIFLVNVGFWSITRYVLTNCLSYFWLFFSGNWSSGSQIPFISSGHGNFYFRRVSYFGSCQNSVSGRTSTSEIAAELRLPLVCDLRTMEVVGSKRLTSPEWVTTGVRLDTRVASAKADSHGRVLRPWEVTGAVSVILSDIFYG